MCFSTCKHLEIHETKYLIVLPVALEAIFVNMHLDLPCLTAFKNGLQKMRCGEGMVVGTQKADIPVVLPVL